MLHSTFSSAIPSLFCKTRFFGLSLIVCLTEEVSQTFSGLAYFMTKHVFILVPTYKDPVSHSDALALLLIILFE